MKLPKKMFKKGKEYKLIKEYKNYGLYEEKSTKIRICFDKLELGLLKEMTEPPRCYINSEKVKI